MKWFRKSDVLRVLFPVVILLTFCIVRGFAAFSPVMDQMAFPRSLDSYGDAGIKGLWTVLIHRIRSEPFNLLATLIFFVAIAHTFLSSRFMNISHRWEKAHEQAKAEGKVPRNSVHHGAELFHFLGEVEVIFGLWAVILIIAISIFFDWSTTVDYLVHQVNFTEAIFVVVIMALASTRPILKLTEQGMRRVAKVLGGSVTAWWLTILTMGPILGSFITEPAAMTLSALLLADKFYELEPSTSFKYGTIGLLFVNISVGGTLTHFAAPPVLMVAAPWGWDLRFMFTHFGWKAVIGIFTANGLYYLVFRKEFSRLRERFEFRAMKEEIRRKYLDREAMETEIDAAIKSVNEETSFHKTVVQQVQDVTERVKERVEGQYLDILESKGIDRDLARKAFEQRFEEIRLFRMRRGLPGLLSPALRVAFRDPEWDTREDPVPAWVTFVHMVFLIWTIVNAHHPELFVPGLLFLLGFAKVTEPYQNRIDLKPALLVDFFLGGLVVHGGLQGWWIEPVLSRMAEFPLMLTATVLTAFNDNAAITFLSTLVPSFTDSLKYMVVAGAVTGGGLTVIANAPNPAGQSLLKNYFENGVIPAKLLVAALAPTAIYFLLFALLR